MSIDFKSQATVHSSEDSCQEKYILYFSGRVSGLEELALTRELYAAVFCWPYMSIRESAFV